MFGATFAIVNLPSRFGATFAMVNLPSRVGEQKIQVAEINVVVLYFKSTFRLSKDKNGAYSGVGHLTYSLTLTELTSIKGYGTNSVAQGIISV